MRTGFNQNLATQILIQREQEEIKNRYDHKGNVIRDYSNEVRVFAESEINNTLPEIPVGVFDGCRKLSEHIQKEKSGSVVRVVKLAPLNPIEKRKSILEFIIYFIEIGFNKISNREKGLPIYNQGKEQRK